MSQDVLLKIYGHIWPTDDTLHRALAASCVGALPQEGPVIFREGDMSRISFEGIYFPLEDLLETLEQGLQEEHQGKLDVLDMEAWMLTRHIFSTGKIVRSSSPLNNVLDHSGH